MTTLTLTDSQKDRVSDENVRVIPVRGNSYEDQLNLWRKEMDDAYEDINKFKQQDLTEILRKIAGYTARFAFIRSQIMRKNVRTFTSFRTGELDPFLEECAFQFKVWSRFGSIQYQEYEALLRTE